MSKLATKIASTIERRVFRKILSRNYRKREEILVIGDSHAEVFDYVGFRLQFKTKHFHVKVVQGATASGLTNPKSTTKAYKMFKKELSRFFARNNNAKPFIIIQLGEVDTGFLLWLKAQTKGTAICELLGKTVHRYTTFISEVSNYGKPIVISAPLPTIGDKVQLGTIANLRRKITTPQADRTHLTVQFNSKANAFCRRKQIVYINLDSVSLGMDNLVSSKLLNKDPKNHHYDLKEYASILVEALKPYLTNDNDQIKYADPTNTKQ